MIKTECDCLLGKLSGDETRKSNIKKMVDTIAYMQRIFSGQGILQGLPLTAKQLVDRRRGYLNRNRYCPICGEQIDWDNILEKIKC